MSIVYHSLFLPYIMNCAEPGLYAATHLQVIWFVMECPSYYVYMTGCRTGVIIGIVCFVSGKNKPAW